MADSLNIDGPEAFGRAFGVTRETLGRLQLYADLLQHWRKAVNLAAPSTLTETWQRHFADSAQLTALAPNAKTWLDLGSGGGFPGLVVAIMLANQEELKVHLIESNGRKCAFLQEVARRTGARAQVHTGRIEEIAKAGAIGQVDVVTARALAPLDELLGLAKPFFAAATQGLFLKGRGWSKEIGDAERRWQFRWSATPSRTDSRGRIIGISKLDRLEGR